MDHSMLHDTILALEDSTWRALTNSGVALLPFLSRDCIMLFPLGMKVSAKTTPNLEDVMRSDAFVPWKQYQMSDVEITQLGSEAALISYRVNATRRHITDDDDMRQDEFKALISSTWRKDPEAGRFLMCVHQQTPYEEDLDFEG
ncbi:uncharacterized protein Z519_10578 [Cladophialophora bantiana CBS 173.52]|uniref:DUF4440 domain-containing protein n=1 Tax=Cladophialophora bantiana (strain ATCC 10958 / CBS 173.52 / CDC B-1940 / NIH 8579) TaxID=1442370 RepID=A0A0D2H735_CLAB1|nr:uncharacterized protein Z519_10578 [Cladophialophora bantiana CBS 173.52]KIW89093.1 hypothetical protein Z519_10578 [Cladophialophora bantiana CBS 173.52]